MSDDPKFANYQPAPAPAATPAATSASADCAASCGEYRPDQVCGDHAPWNQAEPQAEAG